MTGTRARARLAVDAPKNRVIVCASGEGQPHAVQACRHGAAWGMSMCCRPRSVRQMWSPCSHFQQPKLESSDAAAGPHRTSAVSARPSTRLSARLHAAAPRRATLLRLCPGPRGPASAELLHDARETSDTQLPLPVGTELLAASLEEGAGLRAQLLQQLL